MSYPRPKNEDLFVARLLEKEIRALGVNPELQAKFLAFAQRETQADPSKLKPRLYHVIHGRTPSAFLALLMADFFWNEKYQDMVRRTVNDVEYITTDGATGRLEKLVAEHPLSLHILKVRMLRREHAQPEVEIIVRSPILPPKSEGQSEELFLSLLNEKKAEFSRWLARQGELPQMLTDAEGEPIPVRCRPSWGEREVIGESEYEVSSDLSARVDIMDVAELIEACVKRKVPAAYSDDGLDLLMSLKKLFGPDCLQKKISDYRVSTLWDSITKRISLVPWAFFHAPEQFPEELAKPLKAAFEAFVRSHATLVARLEEDIERMENDDDGHRSEAQVFALYEQARNDFMVSVKKALGAKSRQFFRSLLSILAQEEEKARTHLAKLKAAILVR